MNHTTLQSPRTLSGLVQARHRVSISRGWLAVLIAAFGLTACGGGGADGNATSRSGPAAVQGQAAPAANQAPVAVIAAPAAGSTFKAGDTLTILAQGTDAEDGALPAANITWWVDLHHDTHTHPFQSQTVGTGGAITVPARIETSPNIWLRVHVRVTDSAGVSNETTRDVLPVTSTFTLASLPAGLSLTLDGAAVTAPSAVLGVVGVERDIGAADQSLGSRRYRFVGWSDGGSAAHAIATPASATTFTATFADNGPTSNQLPTVSASASSTTPVQGAPVTLSAAAADSDGTVAKVEFFDGATLVGSDTTSPYSVVWTPATLGVHTLQARATDSVGAVGTSAALVVTVSAAPASGLVGTYFPNTSLSGAPVLTRTEALDFVWTGSPGAGLPADGWSARWTGFVRLPTTGVYTFEVIADDGLRATINGQTFASAWVSSGNKTYRSAAINGTAGALVPVLIEHFDGTGDSSVRLRWNAPSAPQYWVPVPLVQLLQTGAVNSPPSVALVAPASAAVGVAVALSANASDSDGSVSKVEFFDGATLIGSDLTGPYGVTWTPATPGNHTLTARATDNLGGITTSSTVTLNVAPAGADLQAPTVAITAPANLADNLGGLLTVTASASDNVGVTGVDFVIDGAALVSSGAGSSYQTTIDTTLHVPGQHVIRARARDAAGNLSPWATTTVRFGGTRTVPAGFTLTQPWVTGMNAGAAFTQAPDGRFFVANQDGRLLVVKAGALLGTPMLTLSVDNTGERGLIGVTLHPSFATNGWIYVYYTRINGALRNNRISRFVVQGDSTTGVETVIADLPDLSSSFFHNGGAMHFGLDGKLYVAVGDNTISAKAQDLNDPFGKMLRFNEDGTIPSNNPFCTTNGNLACAVWAYGLRNPFTFAVQAGSGRMHINDVGAGTWEEVNLGAAGANYGWPASEGPANLTAAMTGPLFTYRHTAAVPPGSGPGAFFIGNAIVGGEFYPASGTFPAQYFGKYFFADYVASYIAVLDPSTPALAFNFATLAQFPVGLLVGKDGALYVLGRTSISRITAP